MQLLRSVPFRRDTPARHRPRQPATPCSKRCFGVVGASHQPPAQRSNTAGRRFRARSGEHAQPTGPTPKRCANHRGQSWAAPCRWQQASQLRASCGQEVQQPEGRSPLDCHMAGRAPTKRMRGDSHAESPAPRCRAVPARTHLRSRLTPCPPPTGPPAHPAFRSLSTVFLFFLRESRTRHLLSQRVWSLSKDRERRMNGSSRDGDGGDQELLEVVPVRIPSTPPHWARACVGGAAGGAGSARTLRRPAPARKARLRSGRLASAGRREEINVSGLSSSSSSRARLSHGQPRPPDGRRSPSLPQSCCVLGWATCGVGLLQPAARSSCWSCVGRM